MQLVREIKGLRPSFVVISGDGTSDIKILERFCNIFDGHERILWYPKGPFPKQTGLGALDAIKIYPSKYQIYSIVCIIDGEFFEGDRGNLIQGRLQGIGIRDMEIKPIREAFLVTGKVGSHEIRVYCIISGSETFIEEEIARLIEIELGTSLDLSGNRVAQWRRRIKQDIRRILVENKLNIKKLINISEINNLKEAFPNICAVLQDIERSC